MRITLLLFAYSLLFFSQPAYAYLPAEMGAAALSSVLGIVLGVVLLLIGAIYYPLKRMIGKLFKK